MSKTKNLPVNTTLGTVSVAKTNTRNITSTRKTKNTKKIRRKESIDTGMRQRMKRKVIWIRYQRMSSRTQGIMTKMKVMREIQSLQEGLIIQGKKEEEIRGEIEEPKRARSITVTNNFLTRKRNVNKKRCRSCGKRKSWNRRCKT